MPVIENIVLTDKDIKNILRYYFSTNASAQAIAEKYGISVSALKQLVKVNAYRFRY